MEAKADELHTIEWVSRPARSRFPEACNVATLVNAPPAVGAMAIAASAPAMVTFRKLPSVALLPSHVVLDRAGRKSSVSAFCSTKPNTSSKPPITGMMIRLPLPLSSRWLVPPPALTTLPVPAICTVSLPAAVTIVLWP